MLPLALCPQIVSPCRTCSEVGLTSAAFIGLFVGIVVAALVTFYLMGRRQKRSLKRHGSPAALLQTYPESPTGNSKGPFVAQTDQADLILPQPLTDKAVKADVESLFYNINLHVENFYHNNPFDAALMQKSQAYRHGELPRGILSQNNVAFEEFLAQPRTRAGAIQALICAELLDSISFFGSREKSLLPLVVNDFCRSISLPSDTSGGESSWSFQSKVLT